DDQTYWDICLPDGTRSFLPETWTLQGRATCSPALTELDAHALLNLARLGAELRSPSCQKGRLCDEQPAPQWKEFSAESRRLLIRLLVEASLSQLPSRQEGSDDGASENSRGASRPPGVCLRPAIDPAPGAAQC